MAAAAVTAMEADMVTGVGGMRREQWWSALRLEETYRRSWRGREGEEGRDDAMAVRG